MPCVKWFPINPLRMIHFYFYFWMHQHQIKKIILKKCYCKMYFCHSSSSSSSLKRWWCGSDITFSFAIAFAEPSMHRTFICIGERDRYSPGPTWKMISQDGGKERVRWECASECAVLVHTSHVYHIYVFDGRKDQSPFELLRVYFSQEWHKFILLLSVISYE